MSAPDPITEDDWNQTPKAVQALLLALIQEVAALRKQVACQSEQISSLQEQVGKTSLNSSRPPSTDPPSVPKPKRAPSGRKRDGQPGHDGTSRTLRPVEEVKEVISVKPKTCQKCNKPLWGADKTPIRHQVTEIPPLVAETIEYQLHTLQCSVCGTQTGAQLPTDVPRGAFGPRVCAMVAALSGQYHQSKRQISELMGDFFGLDIGLGTVCALEQTTSHALEAPVTEVHATIQQQSVANVDETSWQEGTQKGWLWVAHQWQPCFF